MLSGFVTDFVAIHFPSKVRYILLLTEIIGKKLPEQQPALCQALGRHLTCVLLHLSSQQPWGGVGGVREGCCHPCCLVREMTEKRN